MSDTCARILEGRPVIILIVKLDNVEQLKLNNLTVAIELGCFGAGIQNQTFYPASPNEVAKLKSALPSGWCEQDVWAQK